MIRSSGSNEDPTQRSRIARRDHGLIKPGEKLFIIRDAPPADERPGGKSPGAK